MGAGWAWRLLWRLTWPGYPRAAQRGHDPGKADRVAGGEPPLALGATACTSLLAALHMWPREAPP